MFLGVCASAQLRADKKKKVVNHTFFCYAHFDTAFTRTRTCTRTHAHTHDVAHGGGGEGGECEEEMIEVQLARGYESEFARCDDKFVKKKNILEILIVTSWLYLEMLDFVRIRDYDLVSKRQ